MLEDLGKENSRFVITIEVVPPGGSDISPLMAELNSLSDSQFDGFSVATNPVAKARMSAMATATILQKKTGRPAVFHCTTRDHNRISLQGELWGAKALGLSTVMVATGDRVTLADKGIVSNVSDLDVYDLIKMAREADFFTGVVFDTHPELDGLEQAVIRLKKKVAAGAQYVVTQPVYDQSAADIIYEKTRNIGIPVILGILPLRTLRHAIFLHDKVSGIAVPEAVINRMGNAEDSITEGIINASEMLAIAKEKFSGACIMPPFDHYEVMPKILAG